MDQKANMKQNKPLLLDGCRVTKTASMAAGGCEAAPSPRATCVWSSRRTMIVFLQLRVGLDLWGEVSKNQLIYRGKPNSCSSAPKE